MSRTRTIVQKFGGSSVANPERIRACAARAAASCGEGVRVVVVVSAMGDTTDELLALAGQVSAQADKRELDQLLATGEQVSASLMALALRVMGIEAVSLTGAQAGIRTETVHTRARIRSVDATRMERELAAGRVVVVTGFQGLADTGDVTTLGRGGSDTTAVALAAALNAAECEIYTDVDGVYTADPRIVPGARLLATISYDEMLEAASQGARVMHLRAVELGKHAGVPIRVLHAQRAGVNGGGGRGTLIAGNRNDMEHTQPVSTVALKTEIGRVSLTGLPNRAGIQREIFGPIAAAGISVDDIIQSDEEPATGAEGGVRGVGVRCTLVFTVDQADLGDVRPLVEASVRGIGAGLVHIDLGLAKVSAVGAGMQSQPGVAARMFRALESAGVRVANITTSEIKISCLVAAGDGPAALRVVHEAFGLGVEAGEGTPVPAIRG